MVTLLNNLLKLRRKRNSFEIIRLELEQYLSKKQLDFIDELYENNEVGLALEFICSYIEDNDISISKVLYELLKDYMNQLSLVQNIEFYNIRVDKL
ncbi:MafI family immunity protein [Moraxella atlantae]|uniref:MafI family immunity protein n=1 Tax=Faucicola atlantae TaxID=34059 RepID=A0A378QMM4_9GAMM|nr:MafI family immunity protein [Moraxella atlantae]OPH35825.1 hypothetical protein B5J92_04420 [Moraxella atlantae]STZ01680.1 Uncharacterised protein [Moraxella atlantae]